MQTTTPLNIRIQSKPESTRMRDDHTFDYDMNLSNTLQQILKYSKN